MKLVSELTLGKRLPDVIYLHRSALEYIADELSKFTYLIAKAGQIDDEHWNVVKYYRKDFRLSYLHYPLFFDDSYPALERSSTVDLRSTTKREMDYSKAENPPILHRKELFVHPDHPEYENFITLTQEGETAGLYENHKIIGFRDSWYRLINQSGYALVDGRLFRQAALQTGDQAQVDRHKTAIQRHSLSAPMKSLSKHGYLDGTFSVFDYGCGLGDDLCELEAHGIDVAGWDPAHRPDADIFSADIVNIGFVINVIEDREERIEALMRAYELAGKVLVISAMLASDSFIQRFRPYKDGVITSRNTFQKYYAQSELQAFIEQTLEENAIAIAPGIYYVFRDKLQEQSFLSNRQLRHHQWKQLTQRPVNSLSKMQVLIGQNTELCERFWQVCLELGRLPASDEFEGYANIVEVFGSSKRLFDVLNAGAASLDFELSKAMKKDDLIVYFALALFGKRKPYTRLADGLKRDVKALFGTYKEVQERARHALFEVSDVQKIYSACKTAYENLSASVMDEQHSLTIHRGFLEELPQILRIYVGCAVQLYGELDEVSLIKIHIQSGKVSLMVYDEFDESPLPLLLERIKIKMRDQDVDFFDYVDGYAPQPLYLKSKLIDSSFSYYEKQMSFDRRLQRLVPSIQGLLGPGNIELQRLLAEQGKVAKGYRFYSIKKTG
ncbi:DNA phosphorothioation-associated putative methyltransferase [Neptunomonas qingdaonensis]|nr:DNA phosphorothioation-associated putative methyltransferase [Neptunomonas qingdaonensis]